MLENYVASVPAPDVCACVHAHVCMHSGMYVCMYVYMYVCMYVCTHMYVYNMSVCLSSTAPMQPSARKLYPCRSSVSKAGIQNYRSS